MSTLKPLPPTGSAHPQGYSASLRDIQGVRIAQDALSTWLYQEGEPAGIEIRSTPEGAIRARELAEFLQALALEIEHAQQQGDPPAAPDASVREPSPFS